MRSVSLLLVFVLAKLAILWGHTAPLTGWSLAAYVWQDVMIAFALPRSTLGFRRSEPRIELHGPFTGRLRFTRHLTFRWAGWLQPR